MPDLASLFAGAMQLLPSWDRDAKVQRRIELISNKQQVYGSGGQVEGGGQIQDGDICKSVG